MLSQDQPSSDGEFEDSADQFMILLSSEAVSANIPSKTFRIRGLIQGMDMLMLLDSGSTHSFLNAVHVPKLFGLSTMHTPLSVRVANGTVLQCALELPTVVWSVQDLSFTSTFKILPLPFYDAILGMDWFEKLSLMTVDWKHKWLSIPYNDSIVILQGCQPLVPTGTVLEIKKVPPAVEDYAHLCSAEESQLSEPVALLLRKFQHVFQPPSTLPPTRPCDHTIPLIEGARPVNIRPYRLSPAMKDEVESQVADMLQNGLIQHSDSAFSSPALLVKKKDGSWRFCVDYRHLNALTVKSKYPVPIIDELLDELFGASWFSILDLRAGFHQILLKEGESHKTAFQTHTGHYEFRVMAFGLTGAPGTFQKAMNHTLAPLLRKCALVFFDDILVYSASLEDHIHHLQRVLELLARDQWQVKLSKCSFAKQQVFYLGHVIDAQGVATDPLKIQAIAEWPKPNCIKDLRSFLGLAGYYRKFIRHFGVICQSLTTLLKKGSLFVWTNDHDLAFNTLKKALMSAPVLALLDFTTTFLVETDASALGVGAVLMQRGHPLAFLSKALGPKSRGLSTYEKEYLAVILAVQQWRPYLQHHEFVILTDHKSLTQLNEQRLHTPWQHKVFTKLLGLQYKVHYRPGSENRVTDALSRCAHAALRAMSSIVPQWLMDVQNSYAQDAEAQSMLAKLSLDPAAIPNFVLKSGLLRYKGCIWLGADEVLQHRIVSALHCSAVGGHSGVPATYSRVKALFAWSKMKQFVQTFVQQCQVCLQAKPDRSAYPGKLQPLEVPHSAWHTVSLDFVEGLPRSGTADCILVVVDKFSKFAHFLPLSHPYTAATVAQLFLSQVYRLHGFPLVVVSDRDPVFTSNFWQNLFKLAGTELRMSSSYHPQSDGQTERVNQCLETFLRCFVNSCPKKWSAWLPTAEFWYNTSLHASLGCSPFEVLYGRKPHTLGISIDDTVPASLSDWLQERSHMQDLIHQHLLRAQLRMQRQADKHRSERSFAIGDWVYLKLQPYVQSSVLPRVHHKLSFKYFGPYQITSRVGSVAYRLALPDVSKIHPVVHVSQLKLAAGYKGPAPATLPTNLPEFSVPAQVLQTRGVTKGNRLVQQVLVEWSGLPRDLATWEDLEALRQCFPFAPAWGQAGPQGGGNVTTSTPSLSQPQNLSLRRQTGRRERRANVRLAGPEWV